MKVFIAHAGVVANSSAERLAARLEAEEYDVFYDRNAIKASAHYSTLIESECGACDLMVFYVSAESVVADSYPELELSLVKERWSNPEGRIIPVRLPDSKDVNPPAYLQPLQLLQPTKHVEVRIVKEVNRLRNELQVKTQIERDRVEQARLCDERRTKYLRVATVTLTLASLILAGQIVLLVAGLL